MSASQITARPIDDEARSGEEILAWGSKIGHRVVFFDPSDAGFNWAQPDGASYRTEAFTLWWPLPEIAS